MSPLAWSLTFGGACILAAVLIALACLRAFALENRAEEARYAAMRSPRMGDPLAVPEKEL